MGWYTFDKDIRASLLNFGKLFSNLTEYRGFSYLGMYLKKLEFQSFEHFFLVKLTTSVPEKEHQD